ncbi:MAG: hypothetical protein K8S18_02005 [Desulfobacula sp.]|nr:hypothetical protein [Desulfobacula sp.]
MVKEIKRLDSEIARTKLRNSHLIGGKINQFYSKEYGKDTFKLLAENTGINKNTLYKHCQVASELTKEDIDVLCDGGHFSLALKHVKAYLKFGREMIMKIFSESKTPKEFRETFEKLRAEEREKENNKDNSAKDHTGTSSEKSAKDKEANGDPIEQPAIKKNCPQETNLPPSENADQPKSAEKTEDKPSHNVDKNLEKPESDNDSVFETTSSHNSESKSEPSEKPPQKAEDNAEASKLDDIKQSAGSRVKTPPPTDKINGTPEDILNEDVLEDQEESDNEFVNFVNAKTELDSLKKENETLRKERDILHQENEGLKQLIKALEAQLTQKELEPT